MSATPDEPQTEDPYYRPTVSVRLVYLAHACGCVVIETLPQFRATSYGYRDIRCEEHDNPAIPFET